MNEFNLLPMFNVGLDELTNGIDIRIPEYCKRQICSGNNCKEHYRKMLNAEDGIHVCPYGFATYVFSRENVESIESMEKGEYVKEMFTCLRVAGKYNATKLLPKIKSEPKASYREIEQEKLSDYAKAYAIYHKNQFINERHKEYVEDMLHEVRKFNKQISNRNDVLYKKLKGNTKTKKHIEHTGVIQNLCWLTSMRIYYYNMSFDTELTKCDRKSRYNLNKTILKMKDCFSEEYKKKNINFKVKSVMCREISAYDSIELVPFIIIENAIKYSPNEEDIRIAIEETKDKQIVKFKSLGPYIPKEEIQTLCKKGYRGSNAKIYTSNGNGIGLSTAKAICDANNIQLRITSDENKIKEIKGIKFSEFVVEITAEL